ncbi:hypothetical protein ACJMK2_007035, partial [Sinanodonta woodiana]
PVRSVTLRNNTMVNVIEGISETFVCEASPCRPDAGIYWMKNTINITDPQASSSIYQSGSKSITLSSLQFTAVRTDNGLLLACGAYNGFGTGKFSGNVTVIVYYPPDVINFTSPLKVIQGQPLEVVCSADGNPTPQLTWNPVGEDKMNKSRLYYSAVSRNNAVIHTCTATNNMVPTNGSPQIGLDSRQLLIDVLYSPIVNNFTSPLNAIEGKPLEVICSADGNPSPQMSWNPEGDDKVNKSRLYYSAISRNKAVVHTCTATNNMIPTTGSPQRGSSYKELLIDVLYPPTVSNFELPVEAIEGKPLEVICSADGNPSPQLSWNPEGDDKVNKSRLYYSAISRDKTFLHRCTATNHMIPTTGSHQTGSDYKELLINVLYNASIYGFTSKDNISNVNENGSLQLQCQVDSNPYSVISLYLENDLKLKVENAMSLNYTKRAECLDAGTYICSAKNKIMNGTAVSKSIQINVTCYPRLDNRRNISTEHYGALGDNVTLEVYFIAHPEPSDIAWYRREKETDMWQPFPYQSPAFNGSYSSIIVHLATARDFGNYMVNMSNYLGIYSNTYFIRTEREPETPVKFHITDVQEKQVALQWLSGDHRGFDQTFVIQISMDNNVWTNASLINAGKKDGWFSETVTGLKSNTVYYFRLYSFNVNGESDFADIIFAARTLKVSASSLDIGASIGIGFGGFFIGVIGTISVIIIIWKRITVKLT